MCSGCNGTCISVMNVSSIVAHLYVAEWMTMSVLELAKQLLALDLCHGLKERLFEAGRGRLFGACCGCSSAICIFLRLFLLNLGGRWCISGKA